MMRFVNFLILFLALLVTPIAHAIDVTVSGPGGSASQSISDDGGQFDVNLPLKKNSVNKLTITAKDAFGQSAQREVNVTQLSFENLAVASIKAEPLSPARIQELVNSGVIKLDDPSNFNVSVFTIVLTVGVQPIPIQVPIALPKNEPEVGEEQIPPARDPGGRGQGNPTIQDIPPTIVVFNYQPPVPSAPPIPGVIVIEGRIKTLKEFYSAKFLLMNTSGIFTLSEVQAKIEFPDGGLSATLPADGVASLGDILPGNGDTPGQAMKEFIFRGDEKGVRKVRVAFGGTVTGAGIDEPVPFNGAAETSVEVKGPPSFAVKLTHPDFVTAQVPYEFGVEIQNTGDTPALYTSLDLDVAADAEIVDCSINASGDPVCVEVEGAVTRNFGHIYPGQSVKETFLIKPKVTGPITSCMGVSDQNIDLSVTVGNLGCITGKVSPPKGVPTGVPTVNVLPFSNALGISPNSPVVFLFSELMNISTLTTGQGGNLNVYDRGGNIVPGKLRFGVLNGRDIAIWQVNDGILNRFQENSEYSVEVKQTVRDRQGTQLFAAWGSKFSTSGEGLNDFTPPTISLGIEIPVNPNNVYPGQKVRVNAFVADQGSAVQKVELRSDDLSVPGVDFKLLDQKNVLTGDKPPFFFLIDSKNLIPGHTYQLRGTAYDFAGNTQDAFLSLVVSSSAPIPDILFGAGNLEAMRGVPLQITPETVAGGAYEVRYLIDGAPFKTVSVAPFAIGIPTNNLSVGVHTLTAVSTDGLGQVGNGSKDFTVLENTVAPTVSFITPDENQLVIPGSQLSVKADISDVTGVGTIQWYFDNPSGAPFATGVSQFAINTSGIPLGTYKLYVKATNNIGLSNDVASTFRTIQIANPPPAPPPGPPSVVSTPPTGGFTTVSGVTEPNRRVDIKNVTKSIVVTVQSNASGAYSGQIQADSGDTIDVIAYDPLGTTPGTGTGGAVSNPPATVSLDITPATLSFTAFNATADLAAIATRVDSSTQSVVPTYSSSNPAVAGVNASGRVVALGNGTATITGTFDGKSDTVDVTVNVRVLQSLSALPASATFTGVGQSAQLAVTGNFSDATTENVTSIASYVTGNPNVAVVGGGGLITAVGGGTTAITISRPGVGTLQVPVTVNLSDSVLPSVDIVTPVSGSSFERGQSMPIQVSASDAQSGARRIDLSITGAFTHTESRTFSPAASASQTFNVFVPNDAPVPGAITIDVQSEDAAGNRSATVSRTIAIGDQTAPTVTLISPAPNTPYNSGDTISIQISAGDGVGVQEIRYTAEGAFSGGGQQTFTPTPGSQSATFTLTVPFGVVNPELLIKGYGRDAAGNETATSPVTAIITSADITPPATQATSTSGQSGSNITVNYSITDGLSDLDHVQLYFRRNGVGTFNRYTTLVNTQGKFNPAGATGSIVFDSTRMGGDGTFEFYTVGVDAAGNRELAPIVESVVTADQSASISAGAPVTVISTSISVPAGDATYDDKNLLLTGPITVTIDGAHSFRNVELANGAKIVHTKTTGAVDYGLDLTVWTLSISNTSSIDVNARGYLGGAKPGVGGAGRTVGNVDGATSGSGASYGGIGGVVDGATNPLYGNLTAPGELGSGGGSRGGWSGGDGGGKIRISAVNIAADGALLANGGGAQGNAAGDGSGGSINLAVATLSGSGLVTANGGGAQTGGGGGRIAVTFVDIATKDQSLIRALGGTGAYRAGGNGTVFLRDLTQANGNLVVDGQPSVTTFSPLPIPGGFTFDNITLRNNARVVIDQALTVLGTFRVESSSILTHTGTSESGLSISAKRIEVDATSSIDVSGKGYLGGCVGGNVLATGRGDTFGGVDGGSSGSAGSYGGVGYIVDGVTNPLYGDARNVTHLGSGGGCRGGWAGGNGGGRVSLTASDYVEIDGAIAANGSGAAGNAAGDGSGGSVRIDAPVVRGVGLITANGGGAQSGGGGGRVYVTYSFIPTGADGLNDTLNIKSLGGRGAYGSGAAGTVLLKRADQQLGDLIIDDDRGSNATTETELTPVGYGTVQAVTANTLTFDGTYPQLPNGLVGSVIRPEIGSSLLYTVTANTVDTVTVDTTGKPALTSVTSVGATYSGAHVFDNVRTRRGGTLRLSDKLTVGEKFEILGNGRLTHRQSIITPGSLIPIKPRLEIVARDFVLDSTSVVEVSGRGYPGGETVAGQGQNRGFTTGYTLGANGDQGGTYGGLGSRIPSSPKTPRTFEYGSVTDPADYGAGGGSRGGWAGGQGGGWIDIDALSMQIDGVIRANGVAGQGNASGDGAGGTVNIQTNTITGVGSISAIGGAGQCGGGGGRIAVKYASALGMAVGQFDVRGGVGGYNTGGTGSLYFKSQAQTSGELLVDGRGASTPSDQTYLPNMTFDTIKLTNGARVTVDAPVVASQSIQLLNGSSMTHPQGDEDGVDVTAQNLTIDSTSSIDVTGRGYRGGLNSGNASNNGETLGLQVGPVGGAGGSYGGAGGRYQTLAPALHYGSPYAPTYLGSGGGARGGWHGGNGGGRVTLNISNTLDLNGAIRANGTGGEGNASGDGSGGSVMINAGTITGPTGAIAANGGSAQTGGSGGRVYVRYGSMAPTQFNNLRTISAFGGPAAYARGAAGTVVLQNSSQQLGDLYIDDGSPGGSTGTETILTPLGIGVGTIAGNQITVGGGIDLLPGALVGMRVNPDLSQNLSFLITGNSATTVSVDESSNTLASVASTGDRYSLEYRFANVTVRGGATWSLSDQVTVTGNVTVTESGKLTHPDTTTLVHTPGIELFAGAMNIDASSSINVDGRGYQGGCVGANPSSRGLTLGFALGSSGAAGGSYGGLGAFHSGGVANPVYGTANNPFELGSGGGCRGGWNGGDGGGRVKIVAGTMNLSGVISANGIGAAGNASGDGSGGAINLVLSQTLGGTGTVRAAGGASQTGGGGGRVFVSAPSVTLPLAQITANGGGGAYATGSVGTVVVQ